MSTIIFNFLLTISTALNCFDNDNYYTWISLPRQHFFWFLFIFFVCFTILMIINVIQPFQKGCNDPFVIDYEWTSLTQLIYTYNKYIFQKLLKVLNAPSQHFLSCYTLTVLSYYTKENYFGNSYWFYITHWCSSNSDC